MQWLVNRNGKLIKIDFYGLKPGRLVGFSDYTPGGEFTQFLKKHRIAFDPSWTASLHLYPQQALAKLKVWLHTSKSKDTSWLNSHLRLYVTMLNQKYQQAKTPEKAPIAFFNRLAKLYLSIAKRNFDGEKQPNWKVHGEPLEFYALYYPYPRFITPEFGNLQLTDREFLLLWKKKVHEPFPSLDLRKKRAERYCYQGRNAFERYINKIKAALLDPDDQGGWPYRSSEIYNVTGRFNMKAILRQKLQKKDLDRPLYLFALAVLEAIDNQSNSVNEIVAQIQKISPYLALEVRTCVWNAINLHGKLEVINNLTQQFKNAGIFYTPKPSRLYQSFMEKSPNFVGRFRFGLVGLDGERHFISFALWMQYFYGKLKTIISQENR